MRLQFLSSGGGSYFAAVDLCSFARVEAQMAIVEAGLALLPEVFLPYVVAPNEQTLFEVV